MGPLLLAPTLVLAQSDTGEDTGEDSDDKRTLPPISVWDYGIANERPADSFPAPVTALRYQSAIDIQSRGFAEGQADITIRGGIFEGTAVRLGAATLFDPQTGHYVLEVPLDPRMLTAPRVDTGVENGLYGFNSTAATVGFDWTPVSDYRELAAGFGDNDLNYQRASLGQTFDRPGGTLGVQVSMDRSESDGTLDNGDHSLKRASARLQWVSGDSQTDLAAGYQDKFFGWPGMYTGFASLAETDNPESTLLVANHQRSYDSGEFQLTAYHRQIEDDYDFDRSTREIGEPGAFDHKTRSSAVAIQGRHELPALALNYSAQWTGDKLVRSTDLTSGPFTSRDYLKLTLLPEWNWTAGSNDFSMAAGASYDRSNRDSSEVSPLARLQLERPLSGAILRAGLEYAHSSQVPGYTVLASRPAGLFGGNDALGRETSRETSLFLGLEKAGWRTELEVFQRSDDDLVDWTFLAGAPFARQANAVDLDIDGVQAAVSRRGSRTEWVAGYTYLDKDSDYGTAQVDASFYALNYARHRLTFSLRADLSRRLELRWDNEYREQIDNPLRSGSDNAYLAALALYYRPKLAPGLTVSLVADNVSDDDFQEFPGTPGSGRQLSLGFSYIW